MEAQEREILFIKGEEERRRIFDKLYREQDEQKEIEIKEHFEAQEVKSNDFRNQAFFDEMDNDGKAALKDQYHDDSTDDEFFEMPLPPPPNKKTSTDEDEGVLSIASSSGRMQGTPKVENTPSVFTFPTVTRPETRPHFYTSQLPPDPHRPPSLSELISAEQPDPALTSPVKIYRQSDL